MRRHSQAVLFNFLLYFILYIYIYHKRLKSQKKKKITFKMLLFSSIRPICANNLLCHMAIIFFDKNQKPRFIYLLHRQKPWLLSSSFSNAASPKFSSSSIRFHHQRLWFSSSFKLEHDSSINLSNFMNWGFWFVCWLNFQYFLQV